MIAILSGEKYHSKSHSKFKDKCSCYWQYCPGVPEIVSRDKPFKGSVPDFRLLISHHQVRSIRRQKLWKLHQTSGKKL